MAAMEATGKCDVSVYPDKILLFSGKRKSGKDHITDILFERIGPDKSVIIKISGPIKSHWAKALNLDLDNLLSDGQYKERYRLQLVEWSEAMRKQEPGIFCNAAIKMYNAEGKSIWIVSDIRRKTDIHWFRGNFGDRCRTIRIESDQETRENRGWVYTEGIDDAETECDLDDVQDWDLTIVNNNDSDINAILNSIMKLIGD